MSDNNEEYPVTGLHAFLREASNEFRRFRFQAKVNLIGSIILLLFLSRFLIFAVGRYGPTPFRPPEVEYEPHFEFLDFFLLLASLAAVLWSLYVWIGQRRFVSRWGERFERLDALEKRFLPDDSS
ncbi:MAG: hypothetical protein ABSC50_04840 [Candidatus Bathyarchaeia archaeon]|jgi:hypothetical protein